MENNDDYIVQLMNLATEMLEIKMNVQHNTIDNEIKSVTQDYDIILNKFA